MPDVEPTVILNVQDGNAWVTLNRAQRHNALDDALIAELTKIVVDLERDDGVRAVVITGAGQSFCAGADLASMRQKTAAPAPETLADAERLAAVLNGIYSLSKPTLALVRGAAFGGGVGIVAACDLAVAADDARFCLSELRLGLIPAVISPYLIAAIGAREALRCALIGEPFDAAEARRVGLVHATVPAAQAEGEVRRLLGLLARNAPQAARAAKALFRHMGGRRIDPAMLAETAQWFARVRGGEEAREGVAAFLDKRRPAWPGPDRP